jgi:hypothetical protein
MDPNPRRLGSTAGTGGRDGFARDAKKTDPASDPIQSVGEIVVRTVTGQVHPRKPAPGLPEKATALLKAAMEERFVVLAQSV